MGQTCSPRLYVGLGDINVCSIVLDNICTSPGKTSLRCGFPTSQSVYVCPAYLIVITAKYAWAGSTGPALWQHIQRVVRP